MSFNKIQLTIFHILADLLRLNNERIPARDVARSLGFIDHNATEFRKAIRAAGIIRYGPSDTLVLSHEASRNARMLVDVCRRSRNWGTVHWFTVSMWREVLCISLLV